MRTVDAVTVGAPSPNFQLHADKHFPRVERTYVYVGDGSEGVLRASSESVTGSRLPEKFINRATCSLSSEGPSF